MSIMMKSIIIWFGALVSLVWGQTESFAPTRPGEYRGHSHCWIGFSFDFCCEGGPVGRGNDMCWVGEFTYRSCCMAPELQDQRSNLANQLVNLQGETMNSYQLAAHAAATDVTELMQFRQWENYDDLHDPDLNLWVPRALYPAWSKSPAAMDCYSATFMKARFWPKLLENYDNSAARKLDVLGSPALHPISDDPTMPLMSSEIASHLMHLATVESILYDENGEQRLSPANVNQPLSITEVGGGFGAAAILAIDLFDELERYVIVDLPQPILLVKTLSEVILPAEKRQKLILADATDPDVEHHLDRVPTKFFLSCSAYSELHPALRRRYFDTIIQKSDFGMIIDNSYLQWSRGMFDLNTTHSGGVLFINSSK